MASVTRVERKRNDARGVGDNDGIVHNVNARLPAIFDDREYVQAGGLMSLGPNFAAMFRHTAELIDEILRGAKPGDIPVGQPTKFELITSAIPRL
jgi:ABC-type uncharacterized transport system substrate-binding protein